MQDAAGTALHALEALGLSGAVLGQLHVVVRDRAIAEKNANILEHVISLIKA